MKIWIRIFLSFFLCCKKKRNNVLKDCNLVQKAFIKDSYLPLTQSCIKNSKDISSQILS